MNDFQVNQIPGMVAIFLISQYFDFLSWFSGITWARRMKNTLTGDKNDGFNG
jgi:hypothetical protein